MKCNVPGCHCKATEKVIVESIYHGVLASFNFSHCKRHSTEELKRAETELTEKHAKSLMICDPIEDCKRLIKRAV